MSVAKGTQLRAQIATVSRSLSLVFPRIYEDTKEYQEKILPTELQQVIDLIELVYFARQVITTILLHPQIG